MSEKHFSQILPELLVQIRETLLNRCQDLLRDHSSVAILIEIEPKLAPWSTNVLDPRELRPRVNQIVLLHSQKSSDGDCALVLFLRVLAQQYAILDATHGHLLHLATQLDGLKQGKTPILPPALTRASTVTPIDRTLPTAEQRQFHILRALYEYAETYPHDPKMPEYLFWRRLPSNASEIELIEAELRLLERRRLIGKEAWSDEPNRRIWILDEGMVTFRDLYKKTDRSDSHLITVKSPPNKLDALANAHGECASFIHRESLLQTMKASLTRRAAPDTVILLNGQPQTGKTLLLRRLIRGLNGDYVPVFLEGKLLPRHDPAIFVDRLFAALLISCGQSKKLSPDTLEKPAFVEGQVRDNFRAFWETLWRSMENVHPIIIIDEFGSLLEQVDCHLEVVTVLADLVDLACQGQCHLILVVSGPLKPSSNATMKTLIDAILNSHQSIPLRHYTDQNTLLIMTALWQYLPFADLDTWRCLAAQVNGHPRLIDEMLATLAALASDRSRPLNDEMEVRHRFVKMMIRNTDDLMRSLDKALSEEERLVILLICTGRPDIVRRPAFSIPGLIERARLNGGTQISRDLIQAGVLQLLQREWLQHDGGVSTQMYRFKIGIFLHWWHHSKDD